MAGATGRALSASAVSDSAAIDLVLDSITSSNHACASWCHWDWGKNCGPTVLQCRQCAHCQGPSPPAPPVSPPAPHCPPPLPPGYVHITPGCMASCTSREQCSDARCVRCGICQHTFHLEDLPSSSDCRPHTPYDSAHKQCVTFCDPEFGSTHCDLCKCKKCAFCALIPKPPHSPSPPPPPPPTISPSPPPPSPPPLPECFLHPESGTANPGSAHVMFDQYQEGTVVTLDFSHAAASLHVELLDDQGVHNRLFRSVPASGRQVSFMLLRNPNQAGHKKHGGERAALRYQGTWEAPTISCIVLWPPPMPPARPPKLQPKSKSQSSHASSTTHSAALQRPIFHTCSATFLEVESDWGAGYKARVVFHHWLSGGRAVLPLDSAVGTVNHTTGAKFLPGGSNASQLMFELTKSGAGSFAYHGNLIAASQEDLPEDAGSFTFMMKGSVASMLGKGAVPTPCTVSGNCISHMQVTQPRSDSCLTPAFV